MSNKGYLKIQELQPWQANTIFNIHTIPKINKKEQRKFLCSTIST